MPFSRRRQVGVGTLTLRYIGLPLGLARQFRQSGHIAFPIEIIHRITNHKDLCTITIELHINNADFALASHDFGPNMGVHVAIFLDEFGIVNEFQCLTIAFHDFVVLVMNLPYITITTKQTSGKTKLKFTEAMFPMPLPSMMRACKGGNTEPPKMAIMSPAAPSLASSPVSVKAMP